MAGFTIVIHGGAGTILKEDMSDELEKEYLNGLEEAINAGYQILEKGGDAIEAVKASVISLEDNVLFNAGRGAVFTHDGVQEMDASIMDGRDLKAGAVAGIRNIRNPIVLANEVMLHSDHVFLSGHGAIEFARKQKVQFEDDAYFFSQYRFDQLQQAKKSGSSTLDHNSSKELDTLLKDKKFGTVGAVACDAKGNVAAATSTGGMTNKKYGRLGDSPVIGGGTYANNKTCAVSCTGHGEMFIRAVAAYDVSCLMEYRGLRLQEALDIVVNDKLVKLEGEGGIIGVDANGNYGMYFNSEGMYRGVKNNAGLHQVAISK